MKSANQTDNSQLTPLQTYFTTFRSLLVFAEGHERERREIEKGELGFKQKIEAKVMNKTIKASMRAEFICAREDIQRGKSNNPAPLLSKRMLYLLNKINETGLEIPNDKSLEAWITPDINFNERDIVRTRFLESIASEQEQNEMSGKTRELMSDLAFYLITLSTTNRLLSCASAKEAQRLLTENILQVVTFSTVDKWFAAGEAEKLRAIASEQRK